MNFKPNNLIPHNVMSGLFFIILLFSFYLFLAGHNAPGGGFIAGLMTAGAITFLYVTFASRLEKREILFYFKYLIPLGLFCAVGCGLGGILFGRPFLTHTFGYFHVPVFGEIELATVLIFDFGVYLTVIGGLVTIIAAIGEHEYEDAVKLHHKHIRQRQLRFRRFLVVPDAMQQRIIKQFKYKGGATIWRH
jgi:multisubunit Na+/H+ antiporter MnhB subunit